MESTKLWQIADFCLTAKDVKHWLTRLCVCERREVPFRTFPTCFWLHKPESTEPEVAMPTCVPNSSHPSPRLNNAVGLKEWEPSPEQSTGSKGFAPLVEQAEGLWEVCVPVALMPPTRDCTRATGLQHFCFVIPSALPLLLNLVSSPHWQC